MNETRTKQEQARQTAKHKGKRVSKGGRFPAGLVVLLAAVVVVAGALAWATFAYDGIYPNVYFAGVNIGAASAEDAASRLNNRYLYTRDESVTIKYGSLEKKIESSDVDANIDISAIVEQALLHGRDGNALNRMGAVVTSLFSRTDIESTSEPNMQKIKAYVKSFSSGVDRGTKAYDYEIVGSTLYVEMGMNGLKVDQQALADKISASFSSADYGVIDVAGYIVEQNADILLLDDLHNEIHTEPGEPEITYTEDGYEISEHTVGVSFNLAKARADYDQSVSRMEIPLIYTEPKHTKADMEAMLFRDVLADVTTTLNAANTNRTGNVRLSASACNGTILMPGDVFSYNTIVGQRTYQNGYKDASVYISGGIEDQLGGGICQTSSTIYMAVLRAQLEIVERYNHSYTVVYTPLGEDATVYWGSLDFRFKNNQEYPVMIEAFQEKDYITVRIHGTKLDNNTFEIETVVHSHTPYSTIEVQNPEMEHGTRRQKVEGHSAYKTTTYGVIKDENGVEIDRYKINDSRYTRLDKVIEVGTKNAPTEAPPSIDPTQPGEPGTSVEPTPPGDGGQPTDTPSEPPSQPPEVSQPPEPTPTPEQPPADPTPGDSSGTGDDFTPATPETNSD